MKTLLILFTAILLANCSANSEERKEAIEGYKTLKIEECEYLNSTYTHDLTHKGNCSNPIHNSVLARSYQFQIINNKEALLYDKEKIIGKFKFIETQLDSLIAKDNQ